MDGRWVSEVLNGLDLTRISISATIDAKGRLGPIKGLWSKLGALTEAARLGLVEVMVVSTQQPDVPEAMLGEDAKPLRVLRADTLYTAVTKLHDEYGPWSDFVKNEMEQSGRLVLASQAARSVPITEHYQLLPLLQPIKPDRLPKDPQFSEETENHRSNLRLLDVLRWEEAQREERVAYKQTSIDQLFNSFRSVVGGGTVPRFVVLGPPGSGKSTLVQHLAWRTTKGDLKLVGRTLIPARIGLRAWEAWAVKTIAPEESLPEYLAAMYKDLPHAPSAVQWRRRLQSGEVLLLLDGLDEVSGSRAFIATVRSALDLFKECPTVLTCRTVSFEQHKTACSDLPIFILGGLEEKQRDAYIHAYPSEHPQFYNPKGLIEQLRRSPEMGPLSANPLLLSIICSVVDDPDVKALPTTRAELYEKTVTKLLYRKPKEEIAYPGKKHGLPLVRKRRMLERAALTLFAGISYVRELIISEDALLDALTQAAEEEGYRTDAASLGDALLEDLVRNSGILRGGPEEGYFFLHLTIQEFLAGAALARLVNHRGWKASISIGPGRCNVKSLVDKKAWDPRWHEVILLMAGQLSNPEPLITLLVDERQDDHFRHRLALAALCLPELSSQVREAQSRMIDRVTNDAFLFWHDHQSRQTAASVPFLSRSLPALGWVNGRVYETPLLDWIEQEMPRRGESLLGLVDAVEVIGPAAATPPILFRLADLLTDDDREVRWWAVEAVWAIGPAAAIPEFLSSLLDLLRNGDERVCLAVVEAVRALGPAAATSEFLFSLDRLLGDTNKRVCRYAAETVGSLGAAAAKPNILLRLKDLLTGADEDILWSTSGAVRAIGSPAATPDILSCLANLLSHPTQSVRTAAGRAIEALGSAAATPDILSCLADLLGNSDERLRFSAVKTVKALGSAAATPEFLSRLADLLGDTDKSVRFSAAETVKVLGFTAATPEFLNRLVDLLSDARKKERWEVRLSAARAVGALGSAAATPEFLSRLADLLGDADERLRFSALATLEALGSAAATPKFKARLANLLGDADSDIRWSATEAVRILGSLAATPEILKSLAGLLHYVDGDVRWAAAQAVSAIGTAAKTPEILRSLAGFSDEGDTDKLETGENKFDVLGSAATIPQFLTHLADSLGDADAEIRGSAERTAKALGPAAATPEFLTHLAGLLVDTDVAVRESAQRTVKAFGPLAAIPEFLGHLGILLGSAEKEIRVSAVKVVAALGPDGATPEILNFLANLLGDVSARVRGSAADAVGALGPAAATPKILSQLAGLMAEEAEGRAYAFDPAMVRRSAAEAVKALGPGAATPEIISCVVGLLGDKNRDVREAARRTVIEAFGFQMVTGETVSRLVAFLDDKKGGVRKAGAEVVAWLMADGIRIFKSNDGRWKVTTVMSLSDLDSSLDV